MSKQNIIIINPLTQRPVKYGSRVYKQLLRDGVIGNDDETPQQQMKPRHPIPSKQSIPSKQYITSKQPNNYDYDYNEPSKPKPKTMTKQIKSKPVKIEYKQTYEDEIDKLLNDAFTVDLRPSRSNPKIHYEEEEEDEQDEEDEGDDYDDSE
jgi:hypothetical protein